MTPAEQAEAAVLAMVAAMAEKVAQNTAVAAVAAVALEVILVQEVEGVKSHRVVALPFVIQPVIAARLEAAVAAVAAARVLNAWVISVAKAIMREEAKEETLVF